MINPLFLVCVAAAGIAEKVLPHREGFHDWDVPVQDVEDEVWDPQCICVNHHHTGETDCRAGVGGGELCGCPTPPEPAAPSTAAEAAGVDHTPLGDPPAALTFLGFAVPAICDVLADHVFFHLDYNKVGNTEGYCLCEAPIVPDEYDWRQHVAHLIAERLENALLQRFPSK